MRLECRRYYRTYTTYRIYIEFGDSVYHGSPDSNHQEKDHEFPEA